MRIFLAYKFSGSNKQFLQEAINNISNSLVSLGHKTFCFFRDTQKWGEFDIEKSQIIPIALKNLDECDAILLLAMGEGKSTGMGIEAGYAKAKGKLVLLAKKTNIETDYLESLADKVITFSEDLPTKETLVKLLG